MARISSGDARSALNLLELAAKAAPKSEEGRRRSRSRVARTCAAATDPALRQGRRRALQPHFRAAQVDAQQRSRCRGLLAGADARGRGGSALRRAAHGPLRIPEDIGNADPQALTIAVAAQQAAHFIGMPEGNTALAQAAIYLATAPKSNAVYRAYGRAVQDAEREGGGPGSAASPKRADVVVEADGLRDGLPIRPRRAGRRRRHGVPAREHFADGPTTSLPNGASRRKSNGGWTGGRKSRSDGRSKSTRFQVLRRCWRRAEVRC